MTSAERADQLRKTWVPAGVIGLATLALCTFRLGRLSLWDDEGFSVAAAHLHVGTLLRFTNDRDPHTGFYHLLEHYWIALNGDGESWLRFMSAIFAAGAAVCFWLTLRKLFDPLTALAGTALLVLNGFFLAYAQEARPYALALLFTCAAMYAFVCAVETQRTKSWIIWSVCVVAAIYGHPFAAIPTACAHLSLLLAPRRPRLKVWAIAVAVQVAGVIPLGLMLATQRIPHINWVPPISISTLGDAAYVLTGRGGVAMILVVSALVLFIVIRTLNNARRQPRSQQTWAKVLVLLWALGLPAALVVLSLVKHVLVSRYLFPALPGVMAAVVLAVREIKGREYKGIAAVLVALLSLAAVHGWFANGRKDNWRAAVAYVQQNARPGDGIIISFDQRNVFQYYFERDGGKFGSPPTPISPSRPWGSRIPNREHRIDNSSPLAVAKTVAPYTRVWSLYLSTEPPLKNLNAGLMEVFDSSHDERFDPRVVAQLYQNS